jgi:hypothetical protein
VLLSDAAREEIAARLTLTLPETPADEHLLADYRTLLVRFRSLPGLLAELEREVTRRRPVEKPLDEEPGPDDVAPVEAIPVQQIIPSQTIASEEELEAWLNSLRALIVERLAAGKRVKLY